MSISIGNISFIISYHRTKSFIKCTFFIIWKHCLLKQILVDKEENPLPPIDKASLLEPQAVLEKYPKLMTSAKLSTLAVRLSKKAYFGKTIMALCTVRGTGSFHALPGEELSKLKMLLFQQSHPRLIGSRVEFENTWKACVEAIGQACKSLRKPKKWLIMIFDFRI